MSTIWNPTSRRYERNGKAIEPQTVRGWIEQATVEARERIKRIAEEYRSGAINRSEWYLETKQAIKELHTVAGLVAQGGRESMTPQAWGRVGSKLKSEIGFLDGFNNELFNNTQFSDAEFIARAMKYASPGFQTYENMALERNRDAGVKRVVRVLDEGSKHCDDCPALAGEYNIEDVPAIGDSSCGGACHCYIEEMAA